MLSDGQSGMLIIDVALIGDDIEALASRLHAQFPLALLLATGQRAELQAVAGLIGSGRIYRFLHKPISPGRAEAFLTSATRRHAELLSRATRPRFSAAMASSRHRLYALTALLLLVVGASLWWWMDSGRDPMSSALEPATPSAESESPTTASAAPQAASGDDSRRTAPTTADARSAAPTAPATPRTAARSERAPTPQAATPHVDLARAFLAANQLIEPPDASALDSLRKARAADENESAIQIVATDLGTRLLNQALAALDVNDLEGAQRAFAAALSIDRELEAALPDLAQVAARIDAAESTSRQADVGALVARAAQLRQSGQLLEPAGDNALEALQAARDVDEAATEVQIEARQLSFALLEHARTALAAGDIDRADILVLRAEQAMSGLPQARALREQIGAARAQREESAVLQAASLPRTREVPAVYPRDALLKSLEGWVDLEFTISPTGVPLDVHVKDSSRPRTFDNAAIQALRQWRFEPIMQGGEARARRAVLRMEFRLEGR